MYVVQILQALSYLLIETDWADNQILEGVSRLVGVVYVSELEPAVVHPPLLIEHLVEARLVPLGVPGK